MRVSTPTLAAAQGPVLGIVCGFLTRPCCLLPAVMSVGGSGSAGLAYLVAEYRWIFLSTSLVLVGVSLWLNLRWQPRTVNKWLAVLSTLMAFAAAVTLLGRSDLAAH